MVDQAIIELVRHAVAEEQFLYPATRQHVPGGDEIADPELSEHNEAETVMKKLKQADASDSKLGELLGQLMQDVRQHVQEEENELFPRYQTTPTRRPCRTSGKRCRTRRERRLRVRILQPPQRAPG